MCVRASCHPGLPAVWLATAASVNALATANLGFPEHQACSQGLVLFSEGLRVEVMEAEPLCTCSRIATGYMKAAELDKFHDENGTSFQEAASAAGFSAASSQVRFRAQAFVSSIAFANGRLWQDSNRAGVARLVTLSWCEVIMLQQAGTACKPSTCTQDAKAHAWGMRGSAKVSRLPELRQNFYPTPSPDI